MHLVPKDTTTIAARACGDETHVICDSSLPWLRSAFASVLDLMFCLLALVESERGLTMLEFKDPFLALRSWQSTEHDYLVYVLRSLLEVSN